MTTGMSFHSILRILPITALTIAITSCGSSGGDDSGGSSQPAYVNGTTTGQCGSNDLGFYLGAKKSPATITAATANPKVHFDILNGFSSNVSNVHWRVLKDGTLFTSGTEVLISSFEWAEIDFDITPGAGTHVYRIEIDDTGAFSESNENNNFVEYTVAIPASG